MTNRWTSNNEGGWTRAESDAIRGSVLYMRGVKSRRDVIVATAQTGLFPVVQRDDFTSLQQAKEWADRFIDAALELLRLRETVARKEEQAQLDFAEIVALREELHDYRYPKTDREALA